MSVSAYARVATKEQLQNGGGPVKAVTVIPATLNLTTRTPIHSSAKRRVAGYARVSTDSEEQKTSYEAQVKYYTQYIQSRPDWEFVGVYTDEGITATNTRHRDGFKQMVTDALMGKIDLIVTKSVSRFARNTVDSLITVRQLREKGVEVYFEKENIYTLDSKGELLITIMSSLAQEESRSISENVAWGKRKAFAEGKVSLPYKSFLGYTKGPDELPQVVPEEAELVKRIYRMFMSGLTCSGIAKQFNEEEIPTPGHGSQWRDTTVLSILTNEKYKGSAILQKTFTVDFLTKKKKVNEGELPQYYVEHSHEAIIDPAEWEAVQVEIQRRKLLGPRYSGSTVLATRLICGDCGGFYGPKVWHSNDKYRRTVWQCNSKFKGPEKCSTPHLTEEEIKSRFLTAYNSLIQGKSTIMDDCRLIQATLTDCTTIDAEIATLMEELEVVAELTRRCISENAREAQDQQSFTEKYNGYVERYERIKSKIERLRRKRDERCSKADLIGAFMFELSEQDEPLTEFDDRLWVMSVNKAIVHSDGRLVFVFQNGAEVTT